MDNGYATLRCILKVHTGCDACKRHTMEILGSIVGAYDLTMDAERNTAKISGQVDPNYCIKAIARCNGHAELLWANLSHPKMRGGGSYGHYDYGGLSSPYYDSYGESYGPRRRSLPEGMWHDYPTTTTRTFFPPEYSYNNLGYEYDHGLRVVPQIQYPPRIDYTLPYYSEDSMSFCTIM